MWTIWLDLATAVAPRHVLSFRESEEPIGDWFASPHNNPARRVEVLVDISTYGLSSIWDVSAATSYAAFRSDVVRRVVVPIAAKDPHFPYASRDPEDFELSSDVPPFCGDGTEAVGDVFADFNGPIYLRAHALVLMARPAQFDWKKEMEERRL
jgi:hypothetical protein